MRNCPLSLSDRFDIGSIAKEFDAVGILMLAENRKLSLTDPVSKFVPGLPPWSDAVTIDELLHYTSGLPDVDWNTVEDDADNFRNLQALERLDFPAGTHYAYNNNNTFLRRRIIQSASGMSFRAFLETQVFPKAGLRDPVIDPDEETPRVAKGLDAEGKQDAMKVYLTGWTALTVDDLYRWSNCITRFCLIDPQSTLRIATTGAPSWQSGLGHVQMSGGRVVRHVHDGNDHYFQALLMVDPTKGRTIILVTSQNRNDVYAMADAIGAILDGKPYQPRRMTAN
ncbi:MAG TPA: serine hydrolase domain-containing protein [Luteibacter sp.]|uniref:serine hydrolase domain-containing protein n=1 Tax=Luteibacter sp. TaxID=1886636 RepID=UPI002F3F4526